MIPVPPIEPSETSTGASRYWTRRLVRHVAIAGLGSAASVVIAAAAHDKDFLMFRASMATGYVSLVLLAVTLALGPVRLLRGLRSPPSTDLRRDFGVWAAIFALLHVVSGLRVHMGGDMSKYFALRHGAWIVPRLDGFGLANYTGLGATLVLLVLLAISNDVAVRRLGTEQWKKIQRWSYVAAVLIVLHGIAYVVIDHRAVQFIVAFAATVVIAASLQALGVQRTRSMRRSKVHEQGDGV